MLSILEFLTAKSNPPQINRIDFMMDEVTAEINVLIIGPDPGSQGGIGVLMGHLQETTSARTSLHFVNPGSSGVRRFPAFLFAAHKIVRSRRKMDLVHFNVASRGSTLRKVILSLVAKTCRIPYIIHLHGGSYRQFIHSLKPWQKLFVVNFFSSAQRILVLGESWQDYISTAFGIDKVRIGILPNAVPGPEKVDNLVARDGYMIFSGRLSESKGVRDLLMAIMKISPKVSWRLGLAGDYDASLPVAELHQLSRDPRIVLLGWLSQEELGRELDKASIYVLPSHAEGLPLGLLDAMAHSCVPVATPVGAIPEVLVDNYNGILVEVGSPDSLAIHLERLLSDSHKIQNIQKQARRTWEESYSMTYYRAKLDEIYLLSTAEVSRQ